MRIVLLLLVILAVNSLEGNEWLSNDEAAHFFSSMFLTYYSYGISSDVFRKEEIGSRSIGAGFTLSLGLLKEAYDSNKPKNRWDWRDLTWDVAGIVCGLIMINNKVLE